MFHICDLSHKGNPCSKSTLDSRQINNRFKIDSPERTTN
uniref:Uncharacterized protein n=2 Tax=Enterobacteriaceae TaxID=543 RepID=A0A160HS16_ECOLX|nr:hypothetical protein [Escherichia coli]ANR95917.1 hypothetical protein [Klebsiella pneumoniae]UDP42728.1 hypothetical protein [Salmonella enterica subsp. enterica serovar Typhimurium]UHA79855.1 hypothetical protein [Salmonella enterica]WAS08034.1 hypothetical protein [Klebsiella pneumoniae subsp. pneumoniae]